MDKKVFFSWIQNQIIAVSLNLKVAKTQFLPIQNSHGANYQFRKKKTFLAHWYCWYVLSCKNFTHKSETP